MVGSDAGDRTLPPTERRRREARLAGDIVRSAELTSAVTLLSAAFVLWWFAPSLMGSMTSVLRSALTTGPKNTVSITSVTDLIQQSGLPFLSCLVPCLLLVLCFAIVANVIQTGWFLNVRSIAPRLRLRSPVTWYGLAEICGFVLRSALIFVAAGIFAVHTQSQWITVGPMEPASMIIQSARLTGWLLLQLSTSLLVYGVLDYACRFWMREQRLKMTVAERRREQQDEQANPAIRQRRSTIRLQSSGQPSSLRKPVNAAGIVESVHAPGR